MIYTSENNWYYCCYGADNIARQTASLDFKVVYKKSTRKEKSFKEELLNIAQSTMDHYNTSKVDVLFSGGSESDLVLRSYKDVGANVQAIIIRYENDYNLYDVSYAVTICSILNIPYKIIDFNLKKFFESDADSIIDVAQIDRPRALPYCKFLELTDNLPVLGEGDHLWHRYPEEYTIQGNWMHIDLETFFGWFKYAQYKQIPSVPQFFRWTPEYTLSYMNLNWFKALINDEYHGKLGTNSTKLIGYRTAYPDLLDRKKQTGFEKIDQIVNEFEEHIYKKLNGFPFRNLVRKTHTQIIQELL